MRIPAKHNYGEQVGDIPFFFLWEGGVKTILGYKPLVMIYTEGCVPNVS